MKGVILNLLSFIVMISHFANAEKSNSDGGILLQSSMSKLANLTLIELYQLLDYVDIHMQ
jgi:hypothetical protein